MKATYSILTIALDPRGLATEVVAVHEGYDKAGAVAEVKHRCGYLSSAIFTERGKLTLSHYAIRNDRTGKVVACYERDYDLRQQRFRAYPF